MSDGGARSEGAAGTMRRYDALNALADPLRHDLVVTNLANTATEWRALHGGEGNLYCVGMGMVSPWALGLALALPHRQVVALDGDGGILFDPTVLGTMAETGAANLVVVVFDNGGYVSTGRLPTVASQTRAGVSIEALARAYGLAATTETTPEGVARAVDGFPRPRPRRLDVLARDGCSQALRRSPSESTFKRETESAIDTATYGRIWKGSVHDCAPPGKEHERAAIRRFPTSPARAAGAATRAVLHEGPFRGGGGLQRAAPSWTEPSANRSAGLHWDPRDPYVPACHEASRRASALSPGAWLRLAGRPRRRSTNFGAFRAGLPASCVATYSTASPTLVVVGSGRGRRRRPQESTFWPR